MTAPQQKITGAWLSADRTKIILRVDDQGLIQVEPDSDDFARRVLSIPDGYQNLNTSRATSRAVTPEPYRELLRVMIAADGPCQSPTCGVTMLGHLIADAPPRLIELVRAEDFSQP